MSGQYKARTAAIIHDQMLKTMSNDYIKSVGTFSYDLLKSFALESRELEKGIEELHSKLDISNIREIELERFVFQRKGVTRKSASYAKGEVQLKGTRVIQIGDLFETEIGTKFMAVESKVINGESTVRVEAVNSGYEGNVGANSIKYMPITLSGITEVTNPEPTADGYDEESDDSLRERYLIEVQKPATSGNIYHYMQWSREIIGVGDSKIFPLWNGNNTVQIVILNDNKQPADEELVKKVQNYIDPQGVENATWGTGSGCAPIGAYCTVTSAQPKVINVECRLILETDYSIEDVKPLIEESIGNYLKELAFKKNRVSYAVLSSLVLDIKGVVDWTEFYLNSMQTSVDVEDKEVAILGEVSVSVQE